MDGRLYDWQQEGDFDEDGRPELRGPGEFLPHVPMAGEETSLLEAAARIAREAADTQRRTERG
jgi:hypothetical protein